MATLQAGFDSVRAEEFSSRMVRALNEAALCLATSIGHRTGLFDMMAEMPPSTSDEIARRAGLQERYVREWLNGMVTARVIDYHPETLRYSLPREHSGWLTRSAAPDNLAVFTQYIPLLGGVEDDVVSCFHKGGGVPYERFGRFHEVMLEESLQTVVSVLESHILPLIPGLTGRLREGIRVLDVGCGSGQALCMMAHLFPASRFTGYDISEDGLKRARATAASRGLSNIVFEQRDATNFDTDAPAWTFDFVTTFDAIHDQARPAAVLKGIRRCLRPGGVYLMQDIRAAGHVDGDLDHPLGPMLYTISMMHCMSVSLAQGGEGLGAMWGRRKAMELLREAGFQRVEVHELPHDVQNDYYVCHPE